MDPWDDIPGLIRLFEECTLPKAQWTHIAHLTVAHHYLWHYSLEEATQRIRNGIQRYNSSQGNPTAYHETITLAWIAILNRELHQRRGIPLAHRGEGESVRELAYVYSDQDLLLKYYTRERLMSEDARARWIPPDRCAIE
jgi:hypothetical protein